MPLSLAVPNLDLIKRVAEKAREPAGTGRLNGDAEHTRNIRLAGRFSVRHGSLYKTTLWAEQQDYAPCPDRNPLHPSRSPPGSAGSETTSARWLLLMESWIVRRNNTQSIPTFRS